MERRLRLRQTSDFERIRQQGRKYPHRTMILSVMPNELSHNRYGIVTSKRLGNAVGRNRVRRLIREALRSFHAHLQSGFDVVIVARPSVVGQPLVVVRRIIEELLVQSGLLRVESDVM